MCSLMSNKHLAKYGIRDYFTNLKENLSELTFSLVNLMKYLQLKNSFNSIVKDT